MKKTLSVLSVIMTALFLFSCNGTEKNNNAIKDGPMTSAEAPSETPLESSGKNDTPEAVTTNVAPGETLYETVQETAETKAETEDQSKEELLFGYIAPEGWYSPRYVTGSLTGGDYKLIDGVMGLKVYRVQKHLGLRPGTWGYYRDNLPGEVAYFQGVNGLEPTGSVDLKTWKAMGYSEKDWHELGAYISPVRIKRSSCREEIIDIFISRAEEYLGTPFVVGAAGKPGEGVDCSGLVLQCLYTIGIYPDGLDPVQHSTIEEYNSRLMWADPKFKEVSAGELMPGDLVFYRRPWTGTVCHVAIYVGDYECIEAMYSEVEYLPLYKDDDGYPIKGFKRVIAQE